MRRTRALLVLLVLTAKAAASAELTPAVRERTIGMHMTGIAWPSTLPKDLVSGLTNTLLIHVSLFAQGRQLDQKTALIAIKYDLWGEVFALTVTVDETVILTRADETQQQIDAFLANLDLPDLFATNEVPKEGTATLRVEMLLNPIERERLEAIKKWVIQNDTSIPADTSGFSDKRVVNSRSNEVFNKIFEQYAEGADAAAAWKESLSSKPFKIAEGAR
jgi:hypothetical protein